MDNLPKQKTRLIACGMLAREILDTIELNNWDHIELKCLPAELHHHPQHIPAALEKAVAKARAEGVENIAVGYADCGTGGQLDVLCERLGVQRLAGAHCFALYLGLEAFKAQDEDLMTTFFITDFLARHPDTFFYRPLGLDRHPELVETYFANYERALFLAQTEDEELTSAARQIADSIGLAFERRFVGYGDLTPQIAAITKETAER